MSSAFVSNVASLPSRWSMRKIYARHARIKQTEKCKQLENHVGYLELLLAMHSISYERLKSTPIPDKIDHHPLNLEQYTEDNSAEEFANVSNTQHGIGLHTGHQPVASTIEPMPPSTVEGGVKETRSVPMDLTFRGYRECTSCKMFVMGSCAYCDEDMPSSFVAPPPRDTHNGLQCQICKKIFKSKTALREHLGRECLAGKLDRSATPDRSHRRRWNSRERKRSVGRGGSRAEKTSISRGGSQTKVSQTKADEVSRGICEASEKTCEICASDYNVGKEGRWLPCIEEWVRICRSRHLSPKCLNCNANVDRPE